MDQQKLRENLVRMDAESVDERVERVGHLVPATYRPGLPDLLWEYAVQADRLYIYGHFMGVILFCAALAEIVLADQLTGKGGLTVTELANLDDLHKKTCRAHKLSILSDEEKCQIDSLRKLRNELIHANVGNLSERAKQSALNWGVGLFLSPPWAGGIQPDALEHLTNIRRLAVRLYGWNEEEIATVGEQA